MHILALSDTFPNRFHPWRGPYNRRQFECLRAHCEITVIDPIPFPDLLRGAEAWRLRGQADTALQGIPIHHPVFWYLPVAGRGDLWRGLLAAAERALRGPAQGQYDLVVATFAYPHGEAARRLSQRLGIPYVIKARGSDLHALVPGSGRAAKTAAAVREAAAIVAVSRNLAEIARELGAPADRVHVLPNGIDAKMFALVPREEARRQMGAPADRKVVVFVGNLLPVKGVDILLDALALLKEGKGAAPMVFLIGEGPMRGALIRRIAGEGLADSVRLLGHRDRKDVAVWMNAADALVLPSRNEGCPNVVLEALCCGTPVVAARVGAVPDLLDGECAEIVPPERPRELADALRRALDRTWDRAALRRRVEGNSWESNAERLWSILKGVAGPSQGQRSWNS